MTVKKGNNKTVVATFGAGCFWHVQAKFDKIKGVKNTYVGFMGGDLKNPTYEQTKTGQTGHAEVCHIEFDPEIVSYTDLLISFWQMHDPTSLNRQGLDFGNQYRSVIFYHTANQEKEAEKSLKEAQKNYKKPIVTQIVPASEFYKA